jgi:hypothetical protein
METPAGAAVYAQDGGEDSSEDEQPQELPTTKPPDVGSEKTKRFIERRHLDRLVLALKASGFPEPFYCNTFVTPGGDTCRTFSDHSDSAAWEKRIYVTTSKLKGLDSVQFLIDPAQGYEWPSLHAAISDALLEAIPLMKPKPPPPAHHMSKGLASMQLRATGDGPTSTMGA